MAILVNKDTKILIQGMTGKQGLQVTSELLSYGMTVVAGVTPGKGGQEVEGIPIFNSIADALKNVGEVDVSMVYVPPLAVLEASFEAINAQIPLIHIFAEKVPILDAAKILSLAAKKGTRILGPNSVGAISPQEGKIGSIGGPSPDKVFSKGQIGVISKSGGMCSEIGNLLTQASFGQSTVVGIGGDLLIGTAYTDLLLMYQEDTETKAVVAFGEVGGSAEIEAARLIKERRFTKPFIVFMAGRFAESLPKDTALGHAGAIVGLEYSMDQKIEVLKSVGAKVVENFEDIPSVLKKAV